MKWIGRTSSPNAYITSSVNKHPGSTSGSSAISGSVKANGVGGVKLGYTTANMNTVGGVRKV